MTDGQNQKPKWKYRGHPPLEEHNRMFTSQTEPQINGLPLSAGSNFRRHFFKFHVPPFLQKQNKEDALARKQHPPYI